MVLASLSLLPCRCLSKDAVRQRLAQGNLYIDAVGVSGKKLITDSGSSRQGQVRRGAARAAIGPNVGGS